MIQLKSSEDIKRIRDSARILIDTHKLLMKLVDEGISTLQLDKEARNFIQKRGAEPSFLNYNGFPASICVSVNEQVIHGIPANYKLKNGDLVGIDIGVTYKGYISDSANTIAVGSISETARKLLKTTKECLNKGINAASYGARIRDISKAVYGHAKANGFGVVREFCGHGVGFQLHEDPQVPNYISRGPNPRLREGMVIAIEPMINAGGDAIYMLNDDWTVVTADNSLSAHFEHTIAIFEDRTEILTSLE